MPKAILANRIFLDSNPDLEIRLLKELTYFIPKYREDLPPDIICNARVINDKLISIPSGREDLIPPGYQVIDKRVNRCIEWPEFSFTLRDDQQNILDQVESSCLINANPAWGKTFTGIAIARHLQQKTLVVTHTSFLRDQWEAEVQKTIGIAPGIIGGTKVNLNGPIVICNIQKLNNIPKGDFDKMFGTVIVDECHHIPASIFSTTIDKMHATYKIGLTASKKRKDGKHVVFPDYFSKNNYIAADANSMRPEVHRLQLPVLVKDGDGLWAHKMNDLAESPEYQQYIATIAEAYTRKGHNVLVVSDRTSLLTAAHALSDRSICIIGETKDRQDKLKTLRNGEINKVYGSIKIWSEGISESSLSCLVLASPMNNDPLLEQLVGRITRTAPGKMQPVVVDIRLAGNTVFNQGQMRDGFYLNQGWDIRDV
jgi:superfamily II DNA or RNA helicase